MRTPPSLPPTRSPQGSVPHFDDSQAIIHVQATRPQSRGAFRHVAGLATAVLVGNTLLGSCLWRVATRCTEVHGAAGLGSWHLISDGSKLAIMGEQLWGGIGVVLGGWVLTRAHSAAKKLFGGALLVSGVISGYCGNRALFSPAIEPDGLGQCDAYGAPMGGTLSGDADVGMLRPNAPEFPLQAGTFFLRDREKIQGTVSRDVSVRDPVNNRDVVVPSGATFTLFPDELIVSKEQ